MVKQENILEFHDSVKQFSRFILLLFFTSIYSIVCSGQDTIRNYLLPEDFNELSLEAEYGKNKKIPEEFRLPILVALSYFPELKETRIRFVARSQSTAGTASFTPLSFLLANRQFIVYLNNDPKKTGITVKDASFNASLGMIGHELAHVSELSKMKAWSIVFWAIRYAFKKGRAKIERVTDMNTINHGLGWQLYEWTSFILKNKLIDPDYKKLKERYYMQPSEILSILNKTE